MTVKFLLPEERIPTAWYNLAADLSVPPPPPLHPGTHQPAGPDDLAPLFPMGLIMQEMSSERMIEIPDEVREIYRLWRPTPLLRAARWEKALGTPAKIYFKYEGASPAGSHKPNTAIAQAWYNKQEGITKLTTETGAGQWGSALSLACRLFEMECLVYMVKVSYYQKPYRRSMIRVWGAEVIPSPSDTTAAGRAVLAAGPGFAGEPRDSHQRSGGTCRPEGRHSLRAGLGAQPRASAPDSHRPGSHRADGTGRRVSRLRGGLCRRWLQLRRHRLPLRG